MHSYATVQEAMGAVLRDGNVPCVRGRYLRNAGVDFKRLALELGCYVRYDPERDLYTYLPGD
jgi:hypothetical protein